MFSICFMYIFWDVYISIVYFVMFWRKNEEALTQQSIFSINGNISFFLGEKNIIVFKIRFYFYLKYVYLKCIF